MLTQQEWKEIWNCRGNSRKGLHLNNRLHKKYIFSSSSFALFTKVILIHYLFLLSQYQSYFLITFEKKYEKMQKIQRLIFINLNFSEFAMSYLITVVRMAWKLSKLKYCPNLEIFLYISGRILNFIIELCFFTNKYPLQYFSF